MPPQEVNIHVVGNILAGPQAGVNIIPISIPFGIDKFERNWGHFYLIGGLFFKLGANVLVEFKNVVLIGGKWGKCVSGI